MASVNANSLDLLKGVRAQLDVAPWVTAGGAGTFKHAGWVQNLSWEPIREIAKIEPGNNFFPVASYPTAQGYKIKGDLLQADLRLLDLVLGGVDADVLVVTGAATLPLKEITGVNEKQVRIEIADQSLAPGHTEVTQTHVKRTFTFWKMTFRPTGEVPLDKGTPYKVPFEAEAYFDTSVTESTSVGALGKIVDSTTGSYTA